MIVYLFPVHRSSLNRGGRRAGSRGSIASQPAHGAMGQKLHQTTSVPWLSLLLHCSADQTHAGSTLGYPRTGTKQSVRCASGTDARIAAQADICKPVRDGESALAGQAAIA